MITSSSIKPTTRLALGRAHEIGEIFDAREDKFTGIQVFSENFEKFVREIDCGGNEYFFVTEETLESKLEKMNIEAELKMSFIAGLVKVEGCGKYLNETNSSSERISYSVIFKIRTKRQTLKVLNRKLRNEDNLPSDLIDLEMGTHIINGVTWGAQIIATFSKEVKKEKTDLKLEGNLKALINKLSLEVSGQAKFSNEKESEEEKENISVRIIGDIMPVGQDSLITDLEGFKSFLRSVPSLLKNTNRGLGVPLEYNLYPLHKMFDQNKQIAKNILNEISEEFLRKSLKTMDIIKSVQNQINFMIDECYRYEAIFSKEIKDLVEIKELFETDTINFKTKLKHQVVLFRSAEDAKNFTGLEELFSEYSKSEWYPDKVRQKIFETKIYCERKIKFFDRFQNENCKILSPYSSYDEAYLDNKKFRIYFLYTSMKFLKDGDDGIMVESEETNKIHGMFFDLCKDKGLAGESFFYIFDYDSIPKVYEKHGSPNRPRIIYEFKRQRVTDDFYGMQMHLEKVKNYVSWKEEDSCFKIIDSDFNKEKNDFFNNTHKKDIMDLNDSENASQSNDKLLPVLVIGHNISRGEAEDNAVLDCLMQLKKSKKIKKVFVVEHEKFQRSQLFQKINKLSILLYFDNHLLTKDYLSDREFLPNIIDLMELGTEPIDENDLTRYRYEDKFIFFYSRNFYYSNPSAFGHNCKKFRQLLTEKRNHDRPSSNDNLKSLIKRIELESQYYLINYDDIALENKARIQHHFEYNQEISDSCIVLSHENQILSTDYLNDQYIEDKLAVYKAKDDLDSFNTLHSLPKKFHLNARKGGLRSLIIMNEKQIVSVYDDSSIRVWDIDSQKCTKIIENPHQGEMYCAIKLNSRSIITGIFIKIKIIDIESGNCVKELTELDGHVNLLCSINENSFASVSSDLTIKIWDLNKNSNSSVVTFKAHLQPIRSIIMMTDNQLISGSEDGKIKSWDILSRKCLRTFLGHQGDVSALAKLSENLFASGSYDNSINIWDFQKGTCIQTILGFSSSIYSLLRISDKRFASGFDKTIKVWEVGSTKSILSLEGHSHIVLSLQKLNEYDLVSGSADGSIIIWRNFRKFND